MCTCILATKKSGSDIEDRYCNMDYVFGSALKHFEGIKQCIVSYDISCQWYANLHKRIEEDWPDHLKIPNSLQIIPAIPAFHYPAHGMKNHEEFDPRLVLGNGTSDNESPERVWGAHNALGNSSKSMGPESRHFVIDDSLSHWNWGKYVGHGQSYHICQCCAVV